MHEAPKLVRQEEMLNLLLMHLSLKQCGERLNLSYSTVRKYASEPEFLNNLRNLSQSIYDEVLTDLKTERKTLQDRLTEASDKALTKLEELLASAQENVALKAADSILDRTSETARNKKVETDFKGRFTMDPITLLHAAKTASEIDAASQPKVLPATFEPDASKGDHAA
jgi:hypothetical protein